ncbi:MAG: IS1595 family transposase [Winogradskyella sp.]|uniref:IS1595 family transposase n=1 Tax=Winogradskyella sp. TaxID=1883156 RepID=UPI0017DE6375|nr:IS1595 family transposase [Winogradskyella sp.]MBT8243616.1 IS1595 family transposase [Winogradskyella sp.]NNK23850.1 IS1595 family transposase [Winogradskyella sp.]
MNIFSFTAEFGSEEECRLHFKQERDTQGVFCKKCGCNDHYWLKNKWSYQCKACKFRTSLRSGTIMENSNLSFLIWYRTMFLMSVTKKGFSAKDIQRQLGLKRYEPVWSMVHKLRKSIAKSGERYTLEGMIEMDEGYFTVASTDIEKSQAKRGRGAAGEKNVAVMAKSVILEDIETGKKSSQAGYFKAKVLNTHSSKEIDDTIESSLDKRTIVFSNKSTSYVDISDYVELHVTEKSSEQTTKDTLKWVRILISNAKITLLCNYHKIKGNYLQLYLNAFVYKVNRRYFGEKLFDRVVIASINGV